MASTTAASHFNKYHYSDASKKFHMTCNYCCKELIDSKNTNCKVSHLRSCRPDLILNLKNKIKSIVVKQPINVHFCTPSKVNILLYHIIKIKAHLYCCDRILVLHQIKICI